MSNVFAIFPVKNKSAKPTRFSQEKIEKRRSKPVFLKVKVGKKGVLETSNALTGTLSSVIDNIKKQAKKFGVNNDSRMYYNVTLMLAGLKADLEKFLLENLPSDTIIRQDLRDPYAHMGDIANFNIRWLNADQSGMIDLNSALDQFKDLANSFANNPAYVSAVEYYYEQFATYFTAALENHKLAKEEKDKTEMTFEQLRDSLGPFMYPDTGLVFLQHLKNNMTDVKQKATKKSVDLSFDKFFIPSDNEALKISVSNNSKTGVATLSTKKDLFSSIINSTRTKSFQAFPSMFPHIFFSSNNVFDLFMYELRNNVAKIINTLSNQVFATGALSSLYISDTDVEQDKLSKVQTFLDYLEQDYKNGVVGRQVTTQYGLHQPTYNANASTLRI
jgi:hypothetical protein